MSYDEADVKWSGWWTLLWGINVLALLVLAFHMDVEHWIATFMALFMLPELVGLRRHRDSLPPLTYVTRRYLPRWLPDLLTFAGGALLAVLYPTPWFWILDAGLVGWLTNHWDVTYS